MDREYIIVSPYLTVGKFRTTFPIKWHHKVRIKIAYLLLKSLPKNSETEIRITTGSN